jgi:hypothetical protein
MAGLTKAKVEIYRVIFNMVIEFMNKLMQYVLAIFALVMFGKSFNKFILSDTPLDAQKWGAANATFVLMIFAVYAYFFKREEKKEGGKFDKLFDVLLNKVSGNNPPTTPPAATP